MKKIPIRKIIIIGTCEYFEAGKYLEYYPNGIGIFRGLDVKVASNKKYRTKEEAVVAAEMMQLQAPPFADGSKPFMLVFKKGFHWLLMTSNVVENAMKIKEIQRQKERIAAQQKYVVVARFKIPLSEGVTEDEILRYFARAMRRKAAEIGENCIFFVSDVYVESGEEDTSGILSD